MARYDTYHSNVAGAPLMRRWLVLAFLGSLALHAGLIGFFHYKKLEGFGTPEVEVLAPPTFVVNKVTIDPKLLAEVQEEKVPVRPLPTANTRVSVPVDRPEPKQFDLKPQTSEIVTPLLNERPESAPIDLEALTKSQENSAGNADKERSALATALLTESVRAPRQPSFKLPPGSRDGEGMNGLGGIPGRQTIDEALSKAGGAPPTDRPIGMPGGALFEYNKADLREEAIGQLQKIAQLTRLYPRAAFVISGHTDAIGTQEYNVELSRRRAEAVKEWLVENMNVAPERIQTVGKGASELIVSADRSIEEQQPNRRVEIVVKTNPK